MRDIADIVAIMRFHYHANMTSVVNALNQLHLISDESANEKNRRHVMTVIDDILPRLGVRDEDIEKLFSDSKKRP